jgi:hypothetical protein
MFEKNAKKVFKNLSATHQFLIKDFLKNASNKGHRELRIKYCDAKESFLVYSGDFLLIAELRAI